MALIKSRKVRRWIKRLRWPAVIILALNIENLADKLGLSKVLSALYDRAPEMAGGAVQFFQSWLVLTPALLVAGAAGVLAIDRFVSTKSRRIENHSEDQRALDVEAESAALETIDVEPFAGSLLGGPIGGVPNASLAQVPPNPDRKPEPDPETEHEDKKAAKKAITKLCRDYFEPAFLAMHRFKSCARDMFLMQIDRNGHAWNLFSRAIDFGVAPKNDGSKFPTFHDLQRPDKVRLLTLSKAETAYLNNFGEYARDADLAVSVVNQAKGLAPGHISKLREHYQEWRALHDAMVSFQDQMGEEHQDLHSIGRRHWKHPHEVSEPDWARLAKPGS